MQGQITHVMDMGTAGGFGQSRKVCPTRRASRNFARFLLQSPSTSLAAIRVNSRKLQTEHDVSLFLWKPSLETARDEQGWAHQLIVRPPLRLEHYSDVGRSDVPESLLCAHRQPTRASANLFSEPTTFLCEYSAGQIGISPCRTLAPIVFIADLIPLFPSAR